MSSTWIMSSSSFTDWKLSFWSFLLVQRRTFEGEYETQRKMQCCSGYSAASKVATGYSQWRAMGQQVRQQASCSPIVQFSAAVAAQLGNQPAFRFCIPSKLRKGLPLAERILCQMIAIQRNGATNDAEKKQQMDDSNAHPIRQTEGRWCPKSPF